MHSSAIVANSSPVPDPPAPAQNGAVTAPDESRKAVIQPLAITGLVVTRQDLVASLRLYVPQLVDIRPLDAELFVLGLTPPLSTEEQS